MATLIDSAQDLFPTLTDDAPATSQVRDLAEMAGDALAPVSMFATSRVDVVEELAFRALFAVAFAVVVYGVVAAF